MWLPGAEAHPAEVSAAVLILAYHVVTPAILLYRHMAFRTLLQLYRLNIRSDDTEKAWTIYKLSTEL